MYNNISSALVYIDKEYLSSVGKYLQK